jgi:hypothetical protein
MGTVCHLCALEAGTSIKRFTKYHAVSIAENFAKTDNQDNRQGFPNAEELPWRPDGTTVRSPSPLLAACSRRTTDFPLGRPRSLVRVIRPCRAEGVTSAVYTGAVGLPRQTPPGKTSRTQAPTRGRPPHPRPKERGDATTSPLPNAGLAKLVPVTASYDTRRSTCCLPSRSSDLAGPDHWDRRQAGIPESPATRRSSSTVNPSGDTHARPN